MKLPQSAGRLRGQGHSPSPSPGMAVQDVVAAVAEVQKNPEQGISLAGGDPAPPPPPKYPRRGPASPILRVSPHNFCWQVQPNSHSNGMPTQIPMSFVLFVLLGFGHQPTACCYPLPHPIPSPPSQVGGCPPGFDIRMVNGVQVGDVPPGPEEGGVRHPPSPICRGGGSRSTPGGTASQKEGRRFFLTFFCPKK